MSGVGRLEVRSVGDIVGNFFIPSYQRGYRWTEVEVDQLLSDLAESRGSTYYLQPVVVKPRQDGSWELIDGQQRLTTLHLLFRYIRREHVQSADAGYSLEYETRPGSQRYLNELDEASADDNIDYSHMRRAYQCIQAWFGDRGHRATVEATGTLGHLFEGVKVLWYEVPPETDSTALFTRLNVGRIPLTDAELVKAQLLSAIDASATHANRSVEIAAHWDAFERELRVPEVWAFVTAEAEERPSHLGLLLDTLAGVSSHADTPFQTFEALRSRITEDPEVFWNEVVDLHSLILGWYDNRDLYHKVGYLVAVGHSFAELVRSADGLRKSEFESMLDEGIRRHLKLTRSALTDLSYEDDKTADVLLLMNVETVRRAQDSSERYSFSAHASGVWSLEHIHAQSAESLVTEEQWRAWLEDHRRVLEELPGLDEGVRLGLAARIENALLARIDRQTFAVLEQETIDALSSRHETQDDSHAIANLALINHRDNAALSNAVFEVKRQRILERDRRGSYIPAATRKVFLKYYSTARDHQLHFWGASDRATYLAAITDAVAPYLLTEQP